MVTVVLDRAAAEGLPEDVKEYFTARFYHFLHKVF
jgi:hypothetical protein